MTTETQKPEQQAKHRREASDLSDLLVSVKVEKNPGIFLTINGGEGEWNGEKVRFRTEASGGFQVDYKGDTYRFTAEELAGAVIDLVDGTTEGN